MALEWRILKPNPEDVNLLVNKLGLPPIIAQVLANRQITQPEMINRFFNPYLEYLYDPFLIQDMRKAVDRLHQAAKNREKILIFGDYDVDGTTATSLLYLVFREIGIDALYYIPDREKEGYGLSKLGIDYAISKGISLIITCDCGITAYENIDYAKSHGIDVIVTDHHEPGITLPNALAILDPKRADDQYPFKELCGVGVAFKLICAFLMDNGLPLDYAYKHLDLVALGTAADIVPILDENRILVAKGLECLNSTQNIGLQALLKTSGFDNKTISVVNIVFGLAPRLNAAGRLGEATRAVRLLTSYDPQEAHRLASLLEIENRHRQSIEKEIINQAILQLNATHDLDADKIFILSDEKWHHGVIGIVASKLKELYNRPVVLISFQDGIGRGSARSVNGFDLYKAFSQCADLLQNFGGHKSAAGLTIKIESLPEFTRRLKRIAEAEITDDMLNPCLAIEGEITFNQMNFEILKFLEKIAPYGPGNMRPVFAARKVSVEGIPKFIGENNIRFKVRQGQTSLNAIGWNLGNYYEMLISNRLLDLAFVIEENDYFGLKEIQLNVKDIHYASN